MNEIISALDHIDCASCTREEWIEVGMALKEAGCSVDVWDRWSARDAARYRPGECEKKWAGFRGNAKPVTAATIIHMAQERGWTRADADYALEWDSTIEEDGDGRGWHEYEGEQQYGMPEMTPVEQLTAYIRAIFRPDDFVGYLTNDAQKVGEKYIPASAGSYTRTAAQLLESLQRHPDDLGATVGDWNPMAGAWIRFNPLDGKGVGNDNVTSFRFALVESDEMPINDQIAKYEQLQLPIAAMVLSGGKSVHAIVHIDARDRDEYTQRVSYLYDYLAKNGVKVDRQNRNPSRLSRMPGVMRAGHMQKLCGVNMGKATWLEWMDFAEGVDDSLPPLISLDVAFANPIDVPEPLIEGVLRRGHKMLISGSSKAGKSFLIMELCTAITQGGKWLGFQCRKGRVLYINLEIDPASCIQRFLTIHNAMGFKGECLKDLYVWNLRGKAMKLDDLVPKLCRRVRDLGLDAIMFDPLYKVLTGDENNASDMAYFCNQFDRVAQETGCSVIYCHHHSKGMQGGKRAIDRASGSGVFARDPDAQLDMIELDLSDELKHYVADRGDTAWRLECSLREFAPFKPRNFWFRWPLHVLDETGELDKLAAQGSPEAASRIAAASRSDMTANAYIEAYRTGTMGKPEEGITQSDLAALLGVSDAAVSMWMKMTGAQYFEVISTRPKRFRLLESVDQ